MSGALAHDQSVIDNRPPNVAVQFLDRVKTSPSREAYRYPEADGSWSSLTWEQAGDRVRHLAAGLLALGVEREQRVGIASSTRYEWILADLAIMCAGAATTTVYPSTNSGDVAYILADSDCHVVFAEDDEQVEEAGRAPRRAAARLEGGHLRGSVRRRRLGDLPRRPGDAG